MSSTFVPAPTAPTQRPALGFALLIALLALAAAGKAVLFDTLDPDSFLHMLAADQLLRDGIGPIVDHQSFASIQTPWTPYSWLGALAMKMLWDLGGYRAAVAAHALMGAGIMTLIALACREIGPLTGRPRFVAPDHDATRPTRLGAALATALAGFLTLPYLSFRPVTFAILLLALAMCLILRDRRLGERSRCVWLVIPLAALLINIHPFAIVLPMCVMMLLAGAVWERRFAAQPPDWPEAARRVRRYEWLLTGATLACMATPMLPGVIKSVVQLQFNDPMVSGPVVAEYQPFYFGAAGKIAAGVVAVMGMGIIGSYRRLRVGEMLWLALCTALLFRMGRLSPVFAIGVTPFFAATMPRLSDRAIGRPAVCGAVAMMLLIGGWRIGSAFPRRDTPIQAWANRHGPDTRGYPFEAADYLERYVSPATGRIINEYTWGGFLQWRLRGQYQSLLDGRTNLYTPEFWRATYLGDEEARRTFFSNIEADAALLPTERSAFRHALTQLGWRSIYRDDRAEILLPPIAPETATAPEPADWRGWATLLFEE